MIQRIQSLFFFVAGACFGGSFITPFASSDQPVAGIFSDQLYNLSDHIGLQVLAAIGGVLSIVAIFLYNKRSSQIRLGYVVTTLAIILPIIALMIFKNQSDVLDEVIISDKIGLYLPLITIASTLLAIRFIKKDEDLVQSMDRLR